MVNKLFLHDVCNNILCQLIDDLNINTGYEYKNQHYKLLVNSLEATRLFQEVLILDVENEIYDLVESSDNCNIDAEILKQTHISLKNQNIEFPINLTVDNHLYVGTYIHLYATKIAFILARVTDQSLIQICTSTLDLFSLILTKHIQFVDYVELHAVQSVSSDLLIDKDTGAQTVQLFRQVISIALSQNRRNKSIGAIIKFNFNLLDRHIFNYIISSIFSCVRDNESFSKINDTTVAILIPTLSKKDEIELLLKRVTNEINKSIKQCIDSNPNTNVTYTNEIMFFPEVPEKKSLSDYLNFLMN